MATLTELSDLFDNPDLIKKISAALCISVKALLDATPTTADHQYAAKVFAAPNAEAHRILKDVLAVNEAQTVDDIINATDAQIQTSVDAAVPFMRDADANI